MTCQWQDKSYLKYFHQTEIKPTARNFLRNKTNQEKIHVRRLFPLKIIYFVSQIIVLSELVSLSLSFELECIAISIHNSRPKNMSIISLIAPFQLISDREKNTNIVVITKLLSSSRWV